MLSSIANSLGAGSGIDTAALVSNLAAASRAPKAARLDDLARANQARISAIGQLKSNLESFATSLEAVVNGGSLLSQPTVSDETAIVASTIPGSRLLNQTSEILVTHLARAQTNYSAAVAAAANPIGQGGMTLTVGTTSYAITIDSSNDSLTGLAAAINGSGSGVTANLVNDSGGVRLVLKGQSGADKAFSLSTDAGADPGLANFSTSGGLTQGQAAQNADFTVDGIAYSRSSNIISDVVPGVSLTLKKESPTTPVVIGTLRSTEILKQTITDFVSVFNDVRRSLSAALKSTGSDQGLRKLDQQLGALVDSAVTSDANLNSLSDLGLSTNRDGTVALDTAKLTAALAQNPEAVEALFSPIRDNTHTTVSDPGISSALSAIKATSLGNDGAIYALNSRLQSRATIIAADRAKMEVREDAYRARLERQFGNLDSRIGALKATQSYLEQQIKLWTRSN
jgi:flagellar hook-associated protein 2